MITVDTHVALWDALNPHLLSKKASQAIEAADRDEGILLCEMSLWEMAMLIHKKRIDPGIDFQGFISHLLAARKYILVGINPEIAETSVTLPLEVNADPIDRIIAATSLVKKTPLVTADRNLIRATCLDTLW